MSSMDSRAVAMVKVLKTRGGKRQREEFQGVDDTEDEESEFADELELLFGWGLMQAICICRLCIALVHDLERRGQPVHPRIKRIAKSGACGRYANNIRRDFLSYWNSLNLGQRFKPLEIWIPFKEARGPRTTEVQWMLHPLIMVSDLFEHMYQHCRPVFEALKGQLAEFWGQVLALGHICLGSQLRQSFDTLLVKCIK